MRRRGFTLVEIMVSLVVTSLVATLAYAAAQSGFDTGDRVEAHRDGAGRAAIVHGLLSAALRHGVEGVRGGEAVFSLADRARDDGTATDSLWLVTRGVVAPLGTSDSWQVAAWLSGDTLRLEGWPLAGGGDRPPLSMRLPGVQSFDVTMLGRGLAARWSDVWTTADVAPDAVALTLRMSDGSPRRLVVRRGLERAP